MIGQGLRASQSQRALASRTSSHRHVTAARCRSRRAACNASASLTPCKLIGVGSSVPQTRITNDDLSKLVDTTDEWITTRTGIKSRHVIGQGECISAHATAACKKALEMANVAPEDIGLVLLATSSPDDLFGSACKVQAAVGAKNAVAFDLTAACSGFVLGLITASMYIRSGAVKHVLVIGADVLSKFMDWTDRSTCILFGDGCGAVVLSAGAPGEPCALLGMDMHSDGARGGCLSAGLSSHDAAKPDSDEPGALSGYRNIAMEGREVFKFAVKAVPATIEASLASAGMVREDIDWLVMHQANQRILDAAAERLGLPAERVVSNLGEYGNTSAASIPLALDEAVRSGRIQPGQTIATVGFGAGLTWASAIVRWG